jgi:hypothetical protein
MPTKPEIEAAIGELLAGNNAPGYGIAVRGVSTDPPIIDVDIRFISGRTYCCAEPGCHLPRDTSRLPALAGFTIRWHCRVEDGARLRCLSALGMPMESTAYEFEFVTEAST